MGRWFRYWKNLGVGIPLCAATAVASAQTLTTLVNFHGSNGAHPAFTSLTQGSDGYLYGTTTRGGYSGTIFKMTPQGALTTLYTFESTIDGDNPAGTLVEGTNGTYYGTTEYGGTNGAGNIFSITSEGAFSTIYNFAGTDGSGPLGGLVQSPDGYLYGTTAFGGTFSCGTFFKITLQGALTSLHSFDHTVDGCGPLGTLVQAPNGNFFGATTEGGHNNQGEIFEVTPTGMVTTLYSFSVVVSTCPQGLIQTAAGIFYGETRCDSSSGDGTIFSITPAGMLTTLFSFGPTSGALPVGGLVQGTDGNFYGTTEGIDFITFGTFGTVFRVTPDGVLTTLHAFNSVDGLSPEGGLVQDTNGSFYGTTLKGGTDNLGVVFRLSVGLGPFVKTLPVAGKAGTKVRILGTDLTGATSVTFNGAAAIFTVVSPSLITTTVPSGASTGEVQVTTPGGVLSSNPIFLVLR